jgi:hypothetical protein
MIRLGVRTTRRGRDQSPHGHLYQLHEVIVYLGFSERVKEIEGEVKTVLRQLAETS